MGIVRDLYYAKKMSAGLPAPSSAASIRRMFLAKHFGGSYDTLTGSVVSFIGDVNTKIKKLLVSLDPDTGLTGLTVYNDPVYGGTIEWNQLVENGNFVSTSGWSKNSGTISASGNKLTFEATAKSTYQYINHACSMLANHKILMTAEVTLSQAEKVGFGDGSGIVTTVNCTANTKAKIQHIYTPSSDRSSFYIYPGRNSGLEVGATMIVENVMAFDLTEMFGAGKEPPTTSDFYALFPKNYYTNNPGTLTCVSAVNGDEYWAKEVDWTDEAGTLYGGTMDITSGVLTDSVGNTYQLTPQDVEVIIGENHVWSDAGDVEVTVKNAIAMPPDAYKAVLGYSCNNNVYWPITGFHLRGSDTIRISFSANAACNVFGCYQGVDATDNYDLYVSVTSGSKYLRYGNGTYASYWSASDLGNRFDVVFTPTGTEGMPEDSTWTPKTFESENDMLIAATTTTGASSKLQGELYGPVIVDGRLYLIPCERLEDNVLGYYDALHDVFYEPVGTPTSLGYA